MAKSKKMMRKNLLLLLILIAFVFFVPFLTNPDTLAIKDNDLGRTYIPIINFFKSAVYESKNFPLWRPDQMMGEPFIGNALFPTVYPLNIIFLIFPTNLAAVLFYLIHFSLAAVFTFYLARSIFLSRINSFAAALFYTFSTKMLLHTSAGHITMVAAFSYFPLAILAVRKILTEGKFIWVIILSASQALILILYPTIFYYSALFIIFYTFYYLVANLNFLSSLIKKTLSVAVSFLITFGLSAIQLIPQLELGPLSTRSQLRLEDVALPLWNFKRYLGSLLFPYSIFDNLDHESFLYLGLVPTILALLGFLYLPKLKKVTLVVGTIFTLLFVAGLSTPIFKIAFNYLPYMQYLRITTRLWFIVALIAALLAAYFLQKIKAKIIVILIICLFLIESFYIGYSKVFEFADLSFSNRQIYEYLASDKDFFRVYCTTHCFNPQLMSNYKLQVLHGETPIQDVSFINFLQSAGGYSYDKFAVIFPPYQVWQTANLPIPSAQSLGSANVKYIASTYKLEEKGFVYINKFNDLFLYQNEQFKPRVYFKNTERNVDIEKYSPNRIVFSFEKLDSPQTLILSEKFYPGWQVLIDDVKFNVEEEPPIFRKVTIPSGTQRVELVYNPNSFKLGVLITSGTVLLLLILYFLLIHRKGQYYV